MHSNTESAIVEKCLLSINKFNRYILYYISYKFIDCDSKCKTCTTSPSECGECANTALSSVPSCNIPETCSKYVYIRSIGELYETYTTD